MLQPELNMRIMPDVVYGNGNEWSSPEQPRVRSRVALLPGSALRPGWPRLSPKQPGACSPCAPWAPAIAARPPLPLSPLGHHPFPDRPLSPGRSLPCPQLLVRFSLPSDPCPALPLLPGSGYPPARVTWRCGRPGGARDIFCHATYSLMSSAWSAPSVGRRHGFRRGAVWRAAY